MRAKGFMSAKHHGFYIFVQIVLIVTLFVSFHTIVTIYHFDVKSCHVTVRFDPLISIYIHLPSIAPVQTFTIEQRLWTIDSLINSFLFSKSGTNIVLQKKLEN